jgi:hypothetical protein
MQILVSLFLDRRQEDKKIVNWMLANIPQI